MKTPPTIPGTDALAALPQTFLLGISGGLDSCTLLQAVLALGKKPRLVHFDHGWRTASRNDARFVAALARRHHLRIHTGQAPARLPQTENSARETRWAFFAQTASRTRVYDLVLAHHADDQVETFLLQLLRGSGSGAHGMAPVVTRGKLTVHRPWLGVWHAEILAYARAHQLAWREDITNRDILHRRNRIRHRVLPYLRRQFSRHIDQALWRAADIQGAEQEWLDQLCHPEAENHELKATHLRTLPVARQRRTLHLWLNRQGVKDVGFADVEAVRGLLLKDKPAKINLSEGRHARRRAGRLFLDPAP